MDSQMVSAAIQAGATVLGAGLAAGIVIHQIGRQAHHARQQALHAEGLKLKLEIYRELTGICSGLENANIDFERRLRFLDTLARGLLEPDIPMAVPAEVVAVQRELAELFGDLNAKLVAVMLLIEQWQIVDRRLDLFQIAMGVAFRDLHHAWYWFLRAFSYLPPANVEDGLWQPTNEDLEFIRAQLQVLVEALGVILSWNSDFRIEMQTLLVGELFDRSAIRRNSSDDRMFTIRLDKYDEIKRRLEARQPVPAPTVPDLAPYLAPGIAPNLAPDV